MKLHSSSKLITNSSNTTYIFGSDYGKGSLKKMLHYFLSKMKESNFEDFEIDILEEDVDGDCDYHNSEYLVKFPDGSTMVFADPYEHESTFCQEKK